jgi:hypothetical protein
MSQVGHADSKLRLAFMRSGEGAALTTAERGARLARKRFATRALHASEPITQPGDAPQRADGEGQNRTGDTTIFSRVLYQLSYLAV